MSRPGREGHTHFSENWPLKLNSENKLDLYCGQNRLKIDSVTGDWSQVTCPLCARFHYHDETAQGRYRLPKIEGIK